MTRREAIQTIVDVLQEDGNVAEEMAKVILNRLDSCLHFEPEAVQVSAILYGKSKM
jgi:hypothetical protein